MKGNSRELVGGMLLEDRHSQTHGPTLQPYTLLESSLTCHLLTPTLHNPGTQDKELLLLLPPCIHNLSVPALTSPPTEAQSSGNFPAPHSNSCGKEASNFLFH